MAAFNNGFPVTYPQMIYPQYQPIQPAQMVQQNATASVQNTTSGIIWVSGEAGAKAYMVAPNTTVQLWDSESQTVYLKSADASGMPSMKVLDYTIRETGQNCPINAPTQQADYVTKADFDALRGQLESLKMRVGKLAKKEVSENE